MPASTHLQPSAARRASAGVNLQLIEHKLLKQCGILEPSTVILFNPIAQDDTAGRFIVQSIRKDCPSMSMESRFAFGKDTSSRS